MMKKILLIVLCLPVITGCKQNREKLLPGDSGWDKIVIIDKAIQTIEWKYPAEKSRKCNSVAVAPENCGLQSASVLPNGNYLIACGGVPLKINPVKKIMKQFKYKFL
jgi:hypothetical protein